MEPSIDPAASFSLGVAVLHRGDARALDISLRALRRLPRGPAAIVVAEDPDGLRPLALLRRPDVDAWLGFRPGRSPCAEAVASLSGCDVVTILSEGTVLGPSALPDEERRFSSQPDLRASLILAERVLEIGAALNFDLDDPFAVIEAKGRRRPDRAPLYFSPCVLTVAPSRSRGMAFERFAQRSEWAVAHLLMAGEADPTRCFRGRSSAIGHIGRAFERRAPRLQGRQAYQALSRLREAYPGSCDVARRDVRRLVQEQLSGLIRLSSPAARIRFLAGMADARREEASMRRSVARGVADLT